MDYYKPALLIDPATGTGYVLQEDSIIIGRDPSCSICLNDTPVSRRHAILARGEDGWYVRDLSSTNGVTLNGIRLPAEQYYKLETGSQLEIAESARFYFTEDVAELVRYGVLPPEAAAPQPAAEPIYQQPEMPPIRTEPEQVAPAAEPQPEMPPLWTEPEQAAPAAEPQPEAPPLWTEPERKTPATPASSWKTPEQITPPSVPIEQNRPAVPAEDRTGILPEQPAREAPAADSTDILPPPAPAAVSDSTNVLPPQASPTPAYQQPAPGAVPQPAPAAAPQQPPRKTKNSSWQEVSFTAPEGPVYFVPTETKAPPAAKKRAPAGLIGACVAALLLLAAVAVFLIGGGLKSKEVRAVEKEIAAIGEVTLSSEGDIDRARALYESLPESDRAKVKNLERLEASEERYRILVAKKAAEDFDRAVDGIGPITLESGDKLKKLRKQYDAMDATARSFVTKETELSRAEEKYRVEQLEKRAADVDQKITDLGEITLKKEADLRSVRKEVDGLPAEVRAYMSKLDLLKEKESQLEKLKEQKAFGDLQALAAGKDPRKTVDEAMSFLKAYPQSSFRTQAESICVEAYLALAKQYESQKAYESAKKTLEECRDLKLSADEGRSDKALEKLSAAIEKLRPANGKVLSGNIKGGYCQLVVNNGSKDAYIKVQSIDDPKKSLTFFVRANETAKVNVKDGNYSFKYATGDTWYGTEELFGEDTQYSQADTTIHFKTTISGGYVHYQRQTITIYKVVGGNLSTTPIGKNDF